MHRATFRWKFNFNFLHISSRFAYSSPCLTYRLRLSKDACMTFNFTLRLFGIIIPLPGLLENEILFSAAHKRNSISDAHLSSGILRFWDSNIFPYCSGVTPRSAELLKNAPFTPVIKEARSSSLTKRASTWARLSHVARIKLPGVKFPS